MHILPFKNESRDRDVFLAIQIAPPTNPLQKAGSQTFRRDRHPADVSRERSGFASLLFKLRLRCVALANGY